MFNHFKYSGCIWDRKVKLSLSIFHILKYKVYNVLFSEFYSFLWTNEIVKRYIAFEVADHESNYEC